MGSFNQVIPGKTIQEGIVSREQLPTAVPVITSPAHTPDLAAVTPRGPVKFGTYAVSTFNSKFGDTTDPFGMYYNPVTFGIQKLGQAGQSVISFRRLVNNTNNARVVAGVAIFKGKVPNYLRNDSGDYETDVAGNPIADPTTPTIDGILVCPGNMSYKGEVGGAKVTTVKFEVPNEDGVSAPTELSGKFYPLQELVSGIGDSYNSGYATIGHPALTDWNEIGRFVRDNGVYPFTLSIGTLLDSGLRVPANTTNGGPNTIFTMFDLVDKNNTHYNMKTAVGAYTGNNVNRPVELRDAPFDDVITYRNNIATVAQELYQSEYGTGDRTPPVTNNTRQPKYAIMNMLDLVDHYGKPYRTVVFGGYLDHSSADVKITGTRISMNHYLQATGGVSPFANSDGEYLSAPTTWDPVADGEWVTHVNSPALVSRKQAWEMNQALYLAWLTEYAGSLAMKDVIRNRSSFIWDLGFTQSVKDKLIEILSHRKDIIIVPCATEWLKAKSQDQIYSTASMLHARVVMIPESDVYRAETCRAAINLWDSRYINEPTWERFSLNIENMYAFAVAGGGADGKMFESLMPDHEGNRILRIAHDPQVQFEDDDPAANNLILGCVSVTPINQTQFCRAAFPSVFDSVDSVLKDLTNVWKCVCVEKILQDLWIQISGDPQIPRDGYISFMKDNGERRIREQYGSVIENWEIEPSFREDEANARAVMYTTTRLTFSKGVYMLRSTLEAYNEADQAATEQ